MSQPQIVPWKTTEELNQLKKLFFSDSDQDKQQAIIKVKAYVIRGRLLHSLELTSTLTAAALSDRPGCDELAVRMAYAMALIRFVNGLLDPYQKAVHAIPLHGIARKLGLPSSFVEIRHIATHESLPNLQILRTLAREGLRWLREHFWSENDFESKRAFFRVKSNPERIAAEDAARFSDGLKENLRVYRRFHRNGIRITSQRDSMNDPEAKAYWENLGAMESFLKMQDYGFDKLVGILLGVLCFKNVLVVKKKDIKFGQLRALNTPLLDVINSVVEKINVSKKSTAPIAEKVSAKNINFYHYLFDYLLSKQESYTLKQQNSNSKSNDTSYEFSSEQELKQSLKWLEFIAAPKSQKPLIDISDALNLIESYPRNANTLQLLTAIKNKLLPLLAAPCKVRERLEKMIRYEALKLTSVEVSADVGATEKIPENDAKRCNDSTGEDLLDDLSSLRKRLKVASTQATGKKGFDEGQNGALSKGDGKRWYNWEPVEYYEPTPFGVCL